MPTTYDPADLAERAVAEQMRTLDAGDLAYRLCDINPDSPDFRDAHECFIKGDFGRFGFIVAMIIRKQMQGAIDGEELARALAEDAAADAADSRRDAREFNRRFA